jgi:3-keto-5-aminohexanoate cleavage enzyme
LACWRAGAAIIHIHARRDDGHTTMDAGAYSHLAAAIRAAGCDAVIDFSAGDDGGRATHGERLAVPTAGAEIITYSGGSFNLGSRLYDNRPEYLKALSKALVAQNARPEVEVFDSGHIDSVAFLTEAGLSPPYFYQFICGPRGMLRADPALIALLVGYLPQGSEWSVSGQTGSDYIAHDRLLQFALSNAGHVRTGFEDTMLLNNGMPASNNAELVLQWVHAANSLGRPVATPTEARTILRLAK